MMKLKTPNEELDFEYEPVNSVLIDVSHRGNQDLDDDS